MSWQCHIIVMTFLYYNCVDQGGSQQRFAKAQ